MKEIRERERERGVGWGGVGGGDSEQKDLVTDLAATIICICFQCSEQCNYTRLIL